MWIARNSNGCVWLHVNEPKRVSDNKSGGYWVSEGHKMPISHRSAFPRWSDKPVPVQLLADWINNSVKE